MKILRNQSERKNVRYFAKDKIKNATKIIDTNWFTG